jgi:hypothetical protein
VDVSNDAACAIELRLMGFHQHARVHLFRLIRQHLITIPTQSSLWALVFAVIATLLPEHLFAAATCSGHKLLPHPRPEGSCLKVVQQVYRSPDKALRATVLPGDVSLYATPDMESRVVIRTSKGDTLTSKDYASPRGANGYYVLTAKWSPDSQFFVFSMASSGGHSPWSFPTMVYSRQQNRIANFSDMIDGKPTLAANFSFSGPHTLIATTWKQSGALDDEIAVTVDLEAAFGKLPPAPE